MKHINPQKNRFAQSSYGRGDLPRRSRATGFTLIEMMVATSIFIVVLIMAVAALLTSSNAAKQSQALREAMDNVNFAMDSMSRSLRIGTNYSCVTSGQLIDLSSDPSPDDCPLSGSTYGSGIAFESASSSALPSVATLYQSHQAVSGGPHTLERCTADGCVDMTASNVDIQTLKFFVNGSSTTDTIQPSVYILMQGVVIVKNVPTSFAIQTLASQRSSE